MRLLVTGASGYLGRWVCAHLAGQGLELVGFGRRQPEEDLEVSAWRSGDVADFHALRQAAQGCDAIIHLAVQAQHHSWVQPVADLQTNTLGALQALRAAEAAGVARFIFTSSSAVYGAASGCLSEDTPLQPLTPYGVSKAAAEAYCQLFSRAGRLHTTVLRIFNIFGLSQQGHLRVTVEGQFLRAALSGRAPAIHGDPDRAYDFVHAEDVLQALDLTLHRRLPSGQILNVGSGRAASLRDLAGWCVEAAGQGAPVGAQGLHPDGVSTSAPARAWADLSRAQRYLSYAPRHDLRSWVFETAAARQQGAQA